jgi:hypothetical protein
MSVSIAEYAVMGWLRSGASQFPCPQEPAIAVTVTTAGGSSDLKSTYQFSANTNLVLITGGQAFFGLFGSSLFSNSTNGGTSTVSSTSAQILPANGLNFRAVQPRSKVIGWST